MRQTSFDDFFVWGGFQVAILTLAMAMKELPLNPR